MEIRKSDSHNSFKVTTVQLLFEFLGTAFYVIAFNYSAELSLNSNLVRAFAYFATWIVASTVSGAHFNPAMSLVVYFQTGEYKKNFLYLLAVMFIQLCGAFLGTLAAYLILWESSPVLRPNPTLTNGSESMYYTDSGEHLHYGKMWFLEGIMTMIFAIVFLAVKFRYPLKRSDEVLKGVALAFTLYACLELTAGAGACLNPWFGLAQVCYTVGLYEGMKKIIRRSIWVYILAPFAGAILGFILFKFSTVNEEEESEKFNHHQVATSINTVHAGPSKHDV